MCWNKEVSMATFVLAIIGCIYLWKRNGENDRWIALFGATIAMIQLAEFFMWSDLACGKINMYASMFAVLILALEPLMSMIGGIYFSNTPHKNILKWMLVAYIIFIGFLYFMFVPLIKNRLCGTSTCDTLNSFNGFRNSKACNLKWFFLDGINYKYGIIWVLFLMLPFLTMTPKFQGIILFALGFITYAMAATANNAAQGSLWCWLSIGIIYVKILL